MKLKICGMKYYHNILEVSKLEPDYMGFIFWKNSPRYFNAIIPELPLTIKKVGVFVNADLENILYKTKQYKLDLIQLHGQESVSYCKELKDNGIALIKAFSIHANFEFNQLNEYETICDYFLFDTKGKQPGGNGIAFDWTILNNYHLNTPFFLSGGIGLNHCTAIHDFQKTKLSKNCIAIDVNSKFEIQPGLKQTKELFEFKKILHENKL